MFYDTRTITNNRRESCLVWLEPYALNYELLPGHSLKFTGTSSHEGSFEVVDYGDKIGIFDWPGASIQVFRNDTLIEEWPPSRDDDPPSGMSIRQFIEGAFGGPGGVGPSLGNPS